MKSAARNRLTYDGMRRCQRLPELRTPLIPRDAQGYIKPCTQAVRPKSQQNVHPRASDRPMWGTRLTSTRDGRAADQNR